MSKKDSTDRLLQDAGWFVLVFGVLMVLFFVLRPGFFRDSIEPFWDAIAQHQALDNLMESSQFVFQQYGLFLVFAVVLFFWWVIGAGKKK